MTDRIITILAVIGSFALFVLLIFIYRKARITQAQLHRQISEQKEQLARVNYELDSLSYAVSHDLRAPLRAVSGYATMLIEDHSAILDQEGKRLVMQVQANATRMATLLEHLATFSRLGRKEIRRTSIDMNVLIAGVINDIEIDKTNVRLNKLDPVFADWPMMQLVMVNLLSNAIKYSSKKEHPEVRISSEVKDRTITYSISDNGVGFDMQYAANLFGVFQRLHSKEEFEGAGVGLAIAQKIIQKHGGKIWAHSKVNEGATFFFTLPAFSENRSLIKTPL